MQDVFIEYMVRKQRTLQSTLLKLGIGIAAILVFILAFFFSPFLGAFSFFGVLVAFGAVYGGYMLITNMNVEFEYSLTNGEMDIDKITAQRRRKRLLSVKIREVDDFGKYAAQEHEGKAYQTKISAYDHPDADDLYFFVIHHKEKGQTLVIFNANERMLEGMKPYLPRPIFHKVFNRVQ